MILHIYALNVCTIMSLIYVLNQKAMILHIYVLPNLFVLQSTGIATGENGRIGSINKARLVVQANDDPNGLFIFDSNSRDVLIPEDFSPGMKNSTVRNLTVLREQGTWGQVQVKSILFRGVSTQGRVLHCRSRQGSTL